MISCGKKLPSRKVQQFIKLASLGVAGDLYVNGILLAIGFFREATREMIAGRIATAFKYVEVDP